MILQSSFVGIPPFAREKASLGSRYRSLALPMGRRKSQRTALQLQSAWSAKSFEEDEEK